MNSSFALVLGGGLGQSVGRCSLTGADGDQVVRVLVVSPKPQSLLLLLFLFLFGLVLPRASSSAVPHGHLAHAGLGDGGAGYRVFGRFLHDVPCPRLQAPLVAAGFVSPGARSPLAPLAHLAALSTLHGVLQRSETLGALFVAAGFVQVKTSFTLGAEVFTEAGLAVLYPAPGAHVDLGAPHAVVAGRTVLQTLAVLPHPLAPQEQKEFGLAGYAAVVSGAHRAAFTDRIRSIARSLASPPAVRRRLTAAVLHAVQHDQGKGEESKLHLDGGLGERNEEWGILLFSLL